MEKKAAVNIFSGLLDEVYVRAKTASFLYVIGGACLFVVFDEINRTKSFQIWIALVGGLPLLRLLWVFFREKAKNAYSNRFWSLSLYSYTVAYAMVLGVVPLAVFPESLAAKAENAALIWPALSVIPVFAMSSLCYQAVTAIVLTVFPVSVFFMSKPALFANGVLLFLSMAMLIKLTMANYHRFSQRLLVTRTGEKKVRARQAKVEFLKGMIEGNGVGLWHWDLDSNCIYFGNTWIRLFHWPGLSYKNGEGWKNLIHREDYPSLMKVEQKIKSISIKRFEINVRLLSQGKWRWTRMTGYVSKYARDGRPLRVSGGHGDIDAVIRFRNKYERMRTIAKCRQMIAASNEKDEIFHNLCDILVAELPCRFVWIGRPDKEKKEIHLLVYSGLSREASENDLEMVEKCLQENKVQYGNNISRKEKYRREYADPICTDTVYLPLIRGARKECLHISGMAEDYFDSEDIQLLEDLAGDLNVKLAELHNLKNINREKQALQKEKRLFTSGPLVAVTGNISPGFLISLESVSDNIGCLGYTSEEILRENIPLETIVFPGDLRRIRRELEKLFQVNKDANTELVFRLHGKNGTHVVRFYLRSMSGESLRRFQGYLVDVTGIMHDENRLYENKYKILVENSKDAILIIQDGVILYANQAVRDLSEYSPDELIGKKVVHWVAKKSRPGFIKTAREIINGVWASSLIDFSVNSKSGLSVPVEVNITRFIFNGRVAFMAYLRDISRRIKIEETLFKKIEELEQFNRLAVSRELRMIELKKEINQLSLNLGKNLRYQVMD